MEVYKHFTVGINRMTFIRWTRFSEAYALTVGLSLGAGCRRHFQIFGDGDFHVQVHAIRSYRLPSFDLRIIAST